MTAYHISFKFRGEHHKAYVHDYGNKFWRVFFTHEEKEIVRDFGYCITFYASEAEPGKRGSDLKDLERAIRGQLK